MIDYFPIHCLIPAGVLSSDGRSWNPSSEQYLFRVQSLAKEFKKQYPGRYTHRIAISNHRIRAIDNDTVTFTYRDRRNNNELREITPSAMEFIRRFLLHVLPSRFMKIRYYGFLANICKWKSILLIRRLIGNDMAIKLFIEETLQEKVLRVTGELSCKILLRYFWGGTIDKTLLVMSP